MNTISNVTVLTLLTAALLISGGNLLAEGAHEGGHAEAHTGGGHAHESWVTPPAEYASLIGGAIWYDSEAATRGKELYGSYCQSCHGEAGDGVGVVAASLDHKPADLTQHLHYADGSNDAYLFWRITEGGTVEPFRSQNSLMPAFLTSMSEPQRWDVLAYIHQTFHKGFATKVAMAGMNDTEQSEDTRGDGHAGGASEENHGDGHAEGASEENHDDAHAEGTADTHN